MTAVDLRTTGEDNAERAWYAWLNSEGKAAGNVTQQELWRIAFSRGAAWNFRTTSTLAPYLDAFVRLIEYLAPAARDDLEDNRP